MTFFGGGEIPKITKNTENCKITKKPLISENARKPYQNSGGNTYFSETQKAL